jgi:hypothetical protein
VLNRCRPRLAACGGTAALLNASNAAAVGRENFTYRKYMSKSEEEPYLFLPSARVPQHVAAVSEHGTLARRVAQEIKR